MGIIAKKLKSVVLEFATMASAHLNAIIPTIVWMVSTVMGIRSVLKSCWAVNPVVRTTLRAKAICARVVHAPAVPVYRVKIPLPIIVPVIHVHPRN